MDSEPFGTWRELYKAALAETDTQKLPERIQEARRAVVLRSREIFSVSPHHHDEVEAIEAAMYGLNALESCVKLKTGDRCRMPRSA